MTGLTAHKALRVRLLQLRLGEFGFYVLEGTCDTRCVCALCRDAGRLGNGYSFLLCRVNMADPQPSLLLDLDATSEGDPVLDWTEVFGVERPVELEIGIGKGRFLMHAAAQRPDISFVGVEWAGKYLRIALSRSQRRGLQNIRLAKADAREFLEFFVPSSSLAAIYVLFPDPWPKKRHHKRRLVNAGFLAEVERALAPGGRLWLATDHEEYFTVMEEALAQRDALQPVDAGWTGAPTNYEDKFVARGKPIYRRVVEKGAGQQN